MIARYPRDPSCACAERRSDATGAQGSRAATPPHPRRGPRRPAGTRVRRGPDGRHRGARRHQPGAGRLPLRHAVGGAHRGADRRRGQVLRGPRPPARRHLRRPGQAVDVHRPRGQRRSRDR
ncbi:MAG TPA: hypothetical protein VKB69_01305 [Micromonosporaceae bacterium]|nr:hypothetical protein [Micromonosporaceae bacterium]